MPADFTTLDWVIIGGIAVLAAIGLFRGISGEIGSFLGIAAGLLVGYLLYGLALEIAANAASSYDGGIRKAVAIGIDGLFALVAAGLVRKLVKKFVSWSIGKPLDHALVKPGENSSGYFSAKSPVIRYIAEWADAYAEGAAR